MRPDSYGLYTVGDRTFFLRYEAIEYALLTGQKIGFIWDNDVWSTVNWTVPPKESLAFFYAKRAIQIRQYDYVILCYSGGADSWNILQSFKAAKVPIDEIVCCHDLEATGERKGLYNMAGEVFASAIPDAQVYVQEHPTCRLTVIDTLEVLRKYYTEYANKLDEAVKGYFGIPLSFSHPARRGHWFYQEPRYRALVEAGKKVCLVWGHDKIMIQVTPSGKQYVAFTDNFMYTKRKILFYPDLPVYDEFFYWSPELPEMVVKQAHVARKASIPVNEAIYPGWNQRRFQMLKGLGSWYFQTQDEWVKRDPNNETVRIWSKLMMDGYEKHKRLEAQHRSIINPTFGRSPILYTRPYFLD